MDLILHHHLQSILLGCAQADPSIYATFEIHPGSVSLLGCLVQSVFLLEFPQLYQIFIPSTSFSLRGRERSPMELSLASMVGGEQLPSCF
jgi:hypothetical protein